ncbi:MAG: bifunctional protein-serine/threonine kinase/phosphatase, partial [Vibrio sp.]
MNPTPTDVQPSSKQASAQQATDTTPAFRFGGYSSAGLKEQNQDALIAKLPENHDELLLKGMTACIADGV